jgi:hypothetical protein
MQWLRRRIVAHRLTLALSPASSSHARRAGLNSTRARPNNQHFPRLPLAMLLAVALVLPGAQWLEARTAATRAAALNGSVLRIAQRRPCLATAFLHVRAKKSEQGEGILQFEGVPSLRSVAVILDLSGEASRKAGPVLLRSPYSTAPYYVEVRWTIWRVREDSFYFTTAARLVDAIGAPIVPLHEVEPQTTVQVSRDALRIVGADADVL